MTDISEDELARLGGLAANLAETTWGDPLTHLIAAYREQARQLAAVREAWRIYLEAPLGEEVAAEYALSDILASPAPEAVARIERERVADRYYDQLVAEHPDSLKARLAAGDALYEAAKRLPYGPEMAKALAEYERAKEGA